MAENKTRVRMGREGQTLIRERFDSVKCIDQLIDVYAEYGVVYRRPLDRYLTEKNESEIGIVEHIR